MASLNKELEDKGYLTLNKFVAYLREFAPEASISYPTAMRLVHDGKIDANRIGNNWRICRAEVKRWVEIGNLERGLFPSPKPHNKQYWEE